MFKRFYLLIFIFILALPSFATKDEVNVVLFNYQQAVSAHKNGDFENAEFFLKNALNSNPYDYASLIELGEVYIDQGKYNESIKFLSKALNINPNDSLVHVLLGIAFQENKKYESSIYHFNQAIKLEPENSLLRVNLGLVCYEKNDFNCTIDNLGKVILSYPNQLRSRLILASAYHFSKAYAEAAEHYKYVLTYESLNAVVWHNLSKVQIQLNDLENAKISLDKAIALDSNNVDLFLDRADLFFRLNKISDAENDYMKAVSIDPKNPEVFIEFATFFWKCGNYLKSATEFETACSLQPDDLNLLINKASAYQLVKDFDKSIYSWDQVLKVDPNSLIANVNLGKIYQEKQDFDKAIHFYKKCTNDKFISTRDLTEVRSALAFCYLKNKSFDEARNIFSDLLVSNPNDAVLAYNLAVVCLEEGKHEKALPYFEQALKNKFTPLKNVYQGLVEVYSKLNDNLNLKLSYKNWLDVDKDNVDARIAYAKFLAKNGDSLSAIDQYRVAAALDDTSTSRYKLAQFLLEQKDLYGALGQFQEYLKLEPNDVNALILVGNLYRDLNINEQAIEAYNKVLSIEPDNYLTHYNLGLIYQADKKFDESINCFLKTLEINDKYNQSYYALGVSYLLKNDVENAKSYLEKYIIYDPTGQYKQSAQLKIQELMNNKNIDQKRNPKADSDVKPVALKLKG